MKQLLTILFFVFAASAIAQNNSFVKYFDETKHVTTKEKAAFYTNFEKQDTFYKCTSYYPLSNELYSKAVFADTMLRFGIGSMTTYYKSGKLKDSIYFDETGLIETDKEYYESGKLRCITNSSGISKVFKENGEERDDLFVVVNSIPQFPGGADKWEDFLKKNLNTDIPKKQNAPLGIYRVVLTFVVEEDGSITYIRAKNDPGYGTKEEAIRVLSISPKWIPAENPRRSTNKYYPYRESILITFKVQLNN